MLIENVSSFEQSLCHSWATCNIIEETVELLTWPLTTSFTVKQGLCTGPICWTSSYLRSLSYSFSIIIALLSIGDPNCRRSRIRLILRWWSSASLVGGRFFGMVWDSCTAVTLPLVASTTHQYIHARSHGSQRSLRSRFSKINLTRPSTNQHPLNYQLSSSFCFSYLCPVMSILS